MFPFLSFSDTFLRCVVGGDMLRQGLFAQGQIGTQQVRGLALPVTAVRTDQSVPYVQWIDGDKVAHARIQPGPRGNKTRDPDGEAWVKVDGLPAGRICGNRKRNLVAHKRGAAAGHDKPSRRPQNARHHAG